MTEPSSSSKEKIREIKPEGAIFDPEDFKRDLNEHAESGEVEPGPHPDQAGEVSKREEGEPPVKAEKSQRGPVKFPVPQPELLATEAKYSADNEPVPDNLASMGLEAATPGQPLEEVIQQETARRIKTSFGAGTDIHKFSTEALAAWKNAQSAEENKDLGKAA